MASTRERAGSVCARSSSMAIVCAKCALVNVAARNTAASPPSVTGARKRTRAVGASRIVVAVVRVKRAFVAGRDGVKGGAETFDVGVVVSREHAARLAGQRGKGEAGSKRGVGVNVNAV